MKPKDIFERQLIVTRPSGLDPLTTHALLRKNPNLHIFVILEIFFYCHCLFLQMGVGEGRDKHGIFLFLFSRKIKFHLKIPLFLN